MRFVMNPDMVYHYPIWGVGLLLVGAAVFGALLLELCAWRLLPIELRQRHNDVAAAIFSAIGVTYAVLLAFVAKLAWEGFDRAKAASYTEAAVIGDVYNLSAGFADPEKSSIRNEIFGYARRPWERIVGISVRERKRHSAPSAPNWIFSGAKHEA